MYITNTTDTNDTDILDDNKNDCDLDIIIPVLLFSIPFGLQFLCIISIMVFTLVKPLINK